MNKFLKPIFIGIGVTLIMVLVMLKVTMNFQILLFFGSAVFFIAGLVNSNNKSHYLLTTTLIALIFSTFFILIVLKEIPELWYFVPVYYAATFLGVQFKKHKQKTGVSTFALSVIVLFLALKVIPHSLEKSLTQERFDPLPEFSIHEMSGDITESESLKGKTVVLSFFGTWCKPCILELKELDKIRESFKENENVVFYVVNANYGNDTPEKFEAFIAKNNYKFRFAYDYESKIFKHLKMQQFGIPTLLIIDKEQKIRFQHIGYNPAETNFIESVTATINSLL